MLIIERVPRPTEGRFLPTGSWQRIELLERDRALHVGGDVFLGPADSLRGGVGGIRLLLDPAGADERVVVERRAAFTGTRSSGNLRLPWLRIGRAG